MIYYMSDPLELLNSIPSAERKTFTLSSGGIVTVEVISPDQVRIIEVSSTDPMDYMNAGLVPGEVLKI
ncbi:MAG: YlzJ-like family protein [Syntrophomonas sp.]